MYDTIVIGGGIAGLTSALYLARAGMKTLVLESVVCGGQIINSPKIENYPGILDINGFDLINNLKKQVENYDSVEIKYESVVSMEANKVVTANNVYEVKTIIIASGLKKRKLQLLNEDELVGCGVSYCATCDGNFYKNKDVAVVGGGNTALEDALYLSNIAKQVYLIIRRDEFRGDKIYVDKILNVSNIKVISSSQVTKLIGNPLTQIEINGEQLLRVQGIFIAIGSCPNTDFCANLISTDKDGFIISDDTKTNLPNVFVAGDVRTKNLRQLITASSDGANAARYAIDYSQISSRNWKFE